MLTACALVCLSAVVAFSQPIGRPDTPTLAKKVNGFAFVVDTSGSMMMTSQLDGTIKMATAKTIVGLINDRIPALDYDAALCTISPAAAVVQNGMWDRVALGNAASALRVDLPVFGRMTPLGADMDALKSFVNGGAIILVSDGHKNLGPDAVAGVKALLQSTGAKLHIISLADTPEGKDTLKQLADIAGDACVEGRDLLFNPAAVDAFVKHALYDEVTTVINTSVYFATAKYNLTPESMSTLDQAINTILNTPRGVRTVEIEGYADAQGGLGLSNQKLSGNRAAAVIEYLISKGVPADKIYGRGNNVSFKANNNTPAPGRQQNRRVDLIIN